jgi:hypothetical protein
MRSSEPLPTERSALIARIKKVAFTPTRFRGGYDEFRRQLADAVEHLR